MIGCIREELETPVPRFLGPEHHERNWRMQQESVRCLQRAELLMVTDLLHTLVHHLLRFPFVKRVFVSFDGGALPEEVKDFFQFTPAFINAQLDLYTEHIKRCEPIVGPVQLELKFIRSFLKVCKKLRAFEFVTQLGCLMTKNVSFVSVWSAIEAAQRGSIL